eukprot:3520852-Karenia_brevis.AAC.1
MALPPLCCGRARRYVPITLGTTELERALCSALHNTAEASQRWATSHKKFYSYVLFGLAQP